MKRFNPSITDDPYHGAHEDMEPNVDGEYVKLQDVVEWLHTQEESSGGTMAVNLVFDATSGSTEDNSEDWALAKDNYNKGYGK